MLYYKAQLLFAAFLCCCIIHDVCSQPGLCIVAPDCPYQEENSPESDCRTCTLEGCREFPSEDVPVDVQCLIFVNTNSMLLPSFVFENYTDLVSVFFNQGQIAELGSNSIADRDNFQFKALGTGISTVASGAFSNIGNLTVDIESTQFGVTLLEAQIFSNVDAILDMRIIDTVFSMSITRDFFPVGIEQLTVRGTAFTSMDCWAFNYTGFPAEVIWEDNTMDCDCTVQYTVTPVQRLPVLYPVPVEVLEGSTCSDQPTMTLSDYIDDPSSLPCEDLVAVETCTEPGDEFYCQPEVTSVCNFCFDVPQDLPEDLECLTFTQPSFNLPIESSQFERYRKLKHVMFVDGSVFTIGANVFTDLPLLKFEMHGTQITTFDPSAFSYINQLHFIVERAEIQLMSANMFTVIGEMRLLEMIDCDVFQPLQEDFIPFNTTSVHVSGNRFSYYSCHAFHRYEPEEIVWHNNTVSCNCSMNFVVDKDSVDDGYVPYSVLNGSYCIAPEEAQGKYLIDYHGKDMPCEDEQDAVNDCPFEPEDPYSCQGLEYTCAAPCSMATINHGPVNTRCITLVSYIDAFQGLPDGAFSRYKDLVSIRFEQGLITEMHAGAISGFPGDLSIAFWYTNIMKIRKSAFRDIGGLTLRMEYVSLSDAISEHIFEEIDVFRQFTMRNTNLYRATKEGFFPEQLKELHVTNSNFASISCGSFYFEQPKVITWEDTTVWCDCTMEYGLNNDGSMPRVVQESPCSWPEEHQDKRLIDFKSDDSLTLQCRVGQVRVDECEAPGSGAITVERSWVLAVGAVLVMMGYVQL